MNGSKLLLIGVLVGFGGGMAAAIGIKVMRGWNAGGGVVAEVTPAPAITPMLGGAATATPEGDAVAAAPEETATPVAMADTGATESAAPIAKGGKSPRPGGTRVAAIPRVTPKDESENLPVEGPPAKIVFAKPATEGTALARIAEVRAGDNSTVRMELTGKARWKILELPKRHEVWIDFEDVEVPGGEKASSGSKVHVDEVRAKTFDGGAIARVVIKLAHEGKFSVSVSDGFVESASTKGKGRTGEADGMLEVSFMGAVGGDVSASADPNDPWAAQ